MTDRNKSEIAIILDRSGSMETIRKDMEGGLAQFIADRKNDPTEVRVSLYQFDDHYETLYESALVKDVPAMRLVPRGSTALFDAIGRTINQLGDRLLSKPEHERPAAVVVMIITDGQENSSSEFKSDKIAEMIRHQEERYAWKFLYLGADPKGFQDAKAMGIHRSARYSANAAGTQALYAASSRSVGDYFAQVHHGVVGADLTLKPEDGLIVDAQTTPQPIITTK